MGADDLAFLDRITANGKHLLSLVNDVLDIAKIEAGRLTVTTGMVNLDNLIVDVVNSLEGQSRAPGVELRAEVCDVMPIESDPVLLKQVLINLTSNALRFTEKGSVVVKLEVDKNENPLRIRVVDTGIGIPAELHDRIFEPFEQAEDTTHLKYGGTGLGLSISRSICEALGFKLSVESEPNKGSTFTVHLTP
jgi:signal transduction histidine kinase